jgi:hypothetical protein
LVEVPLVVNLIEEALVRLVIIAGKDTFSAVYVKGRFIDE